MHIFPSKIDFNNVVKMLTNALLEAPPVDVGQWHSKDVRGKPDLVSQELRNVVIEVGCPGNIPTLAEKVKPHLPWAEDHFLERVSGSPLNPPTSAEQWSKGVDKTVVDKHKTVMENDIAKYSHTYPERYWPKYAGAIPQFGGKVGIRFRYGDLADVAHLLQSEPMTRQAVLPVWFPEDTGAVHGQRVPCSLYYHFMVRDELMQVQYHIRSCDFVRHFRDDVYLTMRLLQWMCENTGVAKPGTMYMTISSLHIFKGDIQMLQRGDI